MKHALVTGAGGFLGRRVCHALNRAGVEVNALHRHRRQGPWQQQFVVDLASQAVPIEALSGVDTVIHLAGYAHADNGDPTVHAQTSVGGTQRLLDALTPTVRRIVYASSVKAMGERTPLAGLDETSPCTPTTAYGRARCDAERLLLDAADETTAVTVLRLPLVYGPHVAGNILRLMKGVERRMLPRWYSSCARRSMIHVDDVARATVLAANEVKAPGAIYLLSDGVGYTTQEVIDAMYHAAGKSPVVARTPGLRLALKSLALLGDALNVLGISTFNSQRLEKLDAPARYHGHRIHEEIGFEPRHTLPESLPEMFRIMRAQ